jgi:subtilisin family serine protease
MVLGVTAALICLPGAWGQEGKIKIETLDQLPRHTYELEGSVSALLKSDEQFAEFAAKVRADIESDLEKYQIDDAATLQRFYRTLLALDMIEGRFNSALQRVEQIRELEDKEALKLTTGLVTRSLVGARHATGQNLQNPKYRAVFRRHLTASVDRLPWDVVQDQIQEAKGRTEILSEALLMGLVQSQLDPIVAQKGEVSSDLAERIIGLRYALQLQLPLKEDLIAAYQHAIDKNRVAKPDIWPDRSVALKHTRNLTPVLIGIWDSGTDPTVFPGKLFVNDQEAKDGQDNDGNGFVDDLHGIAFDVDGEYSPEPLHPLGEVAGRIDTVMKHLKGFMDIQAAIDSPEASALKKLLSELKQDDVKRFVEDLSLCGLYSHGTHVAGIALQGNPFARILIARITFDYHMIPKALTLATARRHADSYRRTAEYFKQHGVRVVNMSWGWTLKEIESALEANAVGETVDERAELAGEILAILRDGLRDAMKSAPGILFVCGAGNEDSDVKFDESIPSSFDLPNLLAAGAVDQAGEPTSFTSFGSNVLVYANGFEVESYMPGGQRMELSGTSMASPNVANLAAKLIALKPALKPAEVVELIKKGADRREGPHPYLLLNPKRSVELLRQHQ